MGLTITATFEQQGTYFAGDVLECHIRFANVCSAQESQRTDAGPAGTAATRRASLAPGPPGRCASQAVPQARAPSAGHAGPGDASFPALDDGSEYSAGSAMTPGSGPQSVGARPQSKSRGYTSRAALGVFPADNSRPLDAGDGPAPPEDPRMLRSLASRHASVSGSRVTAGPQWGRLTGGWPGTSLGSQLPRLSTSSALSASASTFGSWLPFGGRQHENGSPRAGPASETGSGDSILGSLWRSFSGGPNMPAVSGVCPDTAAAEGTGTEQLAIGFAEASGSLSLATSYFRPDQIGLLLRHGGTGSGTEPGARNPPMGGGLSGRTPTSPRGSPASRTQRSLPLLVSSPAVLFSELTLSPGESQTFSIRMQLPKSLPPSFRGRAASISYDLVVVAKRDMLDVNTHVARIPFRVMAHVDGGSESGVHAFTGPARMPPGSMQLTFQEAAPVSTPRTASPSPAAADDDSAAGAAADTDSPDGPASAATTELMYEQLLGSDFLRRALQAAGHSPAAAAPTLAPQQVRAEDEAKQGVISICRRRAPVEFSLSQGGRAVASVWLPKRAYQLGDLIMGKVRLRPEAASVYQVSVWLESVEVVQEHLASYSADRTAELTRKIHAEHHEFCRGTRTLGFALASLPTAAVSFASDVVSNIWQLRIELIVGPPGSLADDLGLSATTPFPPAKLQAHSAAQPAPPQAAATAATKQGDASSPPPAAAPALGRRSSRPRSSTVAVAAGYNGAAPPLPSRPRALEATTMRRRYDVAREAPARTLSCTVGIQMFPQLSGTVAPGQRDSYAVDLAARAQ